MIDRSLLGDRLELARLNAGMTQQQLADQVKALGFHLTPRLVGTYETADKPSRGPRVPPTHILLAMIRVLDPPGGKLWFADAFPTEIRGVWLEAERPPDLRVDNLLELIRQRDPLTLHALRAARRPRQQVAHGQ